MCLIQFGALFHRGVEPVFDVRADLADIVFRRGNDGEGGPFSGVRDGDDKDTLKVFQKQNRDLSIAVVPYVPTEELPPYYNLIDVFALPAIRDGLPNALLEAMACERAIVATPVGGMPDAIRDDENSRLVSPGDPHVLALTIGKLLDDSTARVRLGQNARATIGRDFTPAQELEGNLAVYRRLLGSVD